MRPLAGRWILGQVECHAKNLTLTPSWIHRYEVPAGDIKPSGRVILTKPPVEKEIFYGDARHVSDRSPD